MPRQPTTPDRSNYSPAMTEQPKPGSPDVHDRAVNTLNIKSWAGSDNCPATMANPTSPTTLFGL